MKGLILNNLLSTKASMLFLTLILFLATVIGIILGTDAPYTIIALLTLVAFPLVYIANFQKDFGTNWNKLELVMPVKRNKVVLSKYLSFLICLITACLLAALYTFANIVTGVLIWETALTSIMLLFLGMVISVGAFFYPIVFKIGADKAETAMVLIFILSAFPIRLMMEIGSRILDLNNVFDLHDYPLFYVAYVLFTIVLFIISYFISKYIYARKEF